MSFGSSANWIRVRVERIATWPAIIAIAAGAVFAGRTWIGKDPRAAAYRSMVASDPHVGTIIEEAPRVLSSLPAIVICASLCNCKKEEASALLAREATGLPARVVVPGDSSMLSAFAGLSQYKRLFVFDPDLQLIHALNATYLPRAYLIGRDGVLLWKPDEEEQSWGRLAKRAALAAKGMR